MATNSLSYDNRLNAVIDAMMPAIGKVSTKKVADEEDLDNGRNTDAFGHKQFDESKQFLRQHHKAQGSHAD